MTAISFECLPTNSGSFVSPIRRSFAESNSIDSLSIVRNGLYVDPRPSVCRRSVKAKSTMKSTRSDWKRGSINRIYSHWRYVFHSFARSSYAQMCDSRMQRMSRWISRRVEQCPRLQRPIDWITLKIIKKTIQNRLCEARSLTDWCRAHRWPRWMHDSNSRYSGRASISNSRTDPVDANGSKRWNRNQNATMMWNPIEIQTFKIQFSNAQMGKVIRRILQGASLTCIETCW